MCKDVDKSSVVVDTHFAMGAITAGTNDHLRSRYHHECALKTQLEASKREDKLDVRLAVCHQEQGTGRMEGGELQGSIESLNNAISVFKQINVYPYNWVSPANLVLSFTYTGSLAEAEALGVDTLAKREAQFGKNDRESYRYKCLFHLHWKIP